MRVALQSLSVALVVVVVIGLALTGWSLSPVSADSGSTPPNPSPWAAVDAALQQAINVDQAFPGCVAIVADRNSILYAKPFGSFTFGLAPPYSGGVNPLMTLGTMFDMASCTKVVATTSAVAMLYQQGYLPLDMHVADPYLLGPAYAAYGKAPITVRNLLLHNAGYPPDPVPWYWQTQFGCPESFKPFPAENWSCRSMIYVSLLNQTLDRPVGFSYVYSDLSFITLQYVVGKVVMENALITQSAFLPGCMNGETTDGALFQCAYEAYVRTQILQPLGMTNSMFLPPEPLWGNCAPAENFSMYTQYPNKQMQGQVSDGNAYAMGGIAGHAGLFSTAPDLAIFMHALMFGSDEQPQQQPQQPMAAAADVTRMANLQDGLLFPRDAKRRAFGGGDGSFSFLNRSTYELFIKEYNNTQSSRALGWNTNDPTSFDEGWDLSCGSMSPLTFLHTGYTGTELCGDPENEVYTVLLTNRVYPTDAPGSTKVHAARVAFNTAALNAALQQRAAAAAAVGQEPPAPVAPTDSPVIPFDFPLYKQCNSSWGNDVMQTETICQVGCLMSSVSMALAGHGVPIDGALSDPASLNTWLQNNDGYAGDNDLDETKVPGINPQRVKWIGFYYNNTALPPSTIKEMLDDELIVIANVMNGGHFVLVTGYDSGDTNFYVNDPGFDKQYYTYDDIVGYRLFDII